MVPPAVPGWRERYGPLLMKLALVVLSAIVGALGSYFGVPPKVIETTREVLVPTAAEMPGGYAQTFGWNRDETAIELNRDEEKTLHFHNTPAGKAALGDDDVFLWQFLRQVCKRPAPWYPNVNQQSVGCCVGCGFKHAIDILLAAMISLGTAAEWKPVSVEVIYGISRVEIGGGRISGDGSVGKWAADGIKTYGVVAMEKHGSIDLTEFSPSRARSFGRSGVSKELETLAKQHPVKNTALVTSWADVKRAVQQRYPVAVCSDQGFTMERDRDGFCKPQGTWNHCMCIIGVRGGQRPGGFILNSWGDQAHTGPTWPADAPVAGFWADANVIDKMVRQGDSFALSEAVGFPQRKPNDWFIQLPRPKHDLILLRANDLAAVRNDWALAP